jgi:uncharacterized protein (TIGR02284 family)
MSTDEKITQDIIRTLEDGKEGFAKAAEKLKDTNRADLCAKFTEYSNQRDGFATELKSMAAQYGDHVEKSGTVAGTLHRGWMAIKDAVAGDSDPEGVLDAAEQGEDHAVAEYEKALQDNDISNGLRTVLQRQYVAVKAAHDDVRDLRNAHAG